MISTKGLHKALSKYHSEIEGVERNLSEFIHFEFSVMYQYSDGFVIVAEAGKNSPQNAPLDTCLKIIAEKGKLTEEDYLSNCI